MNYMPELETVVDFNAGWYVPACGQLAVLLRNATIINDSLLKIYGEQTARSSGFTLLGGLPYWSSTQFDTDNMCIVAENGLVSYEKKWEARFYRAVRSF